MESRLLLFSAVTYSNRVGKQIAAPISTAEMLLRKTIHRTNHGSVRPGRPQVKRVTPADTKVDTRTIVV